MHISTIIAAAAVSVAVVLAWHCPTHPHVNGTLIYLPACCDQRDPVVKGKFNATDCYQAQLESQIKRKMNYTCSLDDGSPIVFGETAGEGCCQDLKKDNTYTCVSVLPGYSQ